MDFSLRQFDIIDSALHLTADFGLSGLTMKRLSSSLGITEPALYRHFPNKSAIVKGMIHYFESIAVSIFSEISSKGLRGVSALEYFIKDRFNLVVSRPALAKVLFSDEQFLDDPEYSSLLLAMMHDHRVHICRMLEEAIADSAIRSDIRVDILFRLVLGPVRLLIKQWGLSQQAFDLIESGNELWASMLKLLSNS